MAEAEEKRLEEQRTRLGPEGLSEKAEILKKATEENERPTPDEIFDDFPVPDPDSINFYETKLWTSTDPAQHGLDLEQVGCPSACLDINSQFGHVSLAMDTNELDQVQLITLCASCLL